MLWFLSAPCHIWAGTYCLCLKQKHEQRMPSMMACCDMTIHDYISEYELESGQYWSGLQTQTACWHTVHEDDEDHVRTGSTVSSDAGRTHLGYSINLPQVTVYSGVESSIGAGVGQPWAQSDVSALLCWWTVVACTVNGLPPVCRRQWCRLHRAEFTLFALT